MEKKTSNRIPRNATKMIVRLNRDIGGGKTEIKKGEEITVTKNERGEWVGGGYAFCVSHLRDPEICTLTIVE